MSIVTLPTSFAHLLLAFRDCFVDRRSFENFVTLSTGWVRCVGRHTITRFIQLGLKPGGEKHHSVFYRFFSTARWDPDDVGRQLFELLLPFLPKVIEALVDDSLCRRSGPHLFGAAMPLRCCPLQLWPLWEAGQESVLVRTGMGNRGGGWASPSRKFNVGLISFLLIFVWEMQH